VQAIAHRVARRVASQPRRAAPTVDGWGCDGSRPRTTGCDPGRELVIPSEAGHDTCNGDSGGAVFEFDEVANQWKLMAITSRAANVLESGCGKGGIYVRIDAAASWIDDIAKGP
jgi:secreted trypsin-like serine protease